MKQIKISKEISLPPDVVTQTIAILAKRRAGKSYTMRRLAEQLLTVGEQIILVDPKGDQWGIRSSADGKSPGFPIVILGGEHGDAPLEVNSGEVVAKLVVEERVSVLIDLSTFRKHEIATFMAIFLENLYRLKAQEKYRTPVMLIIDEADAIAPQKPQKGEERMLGAAEDIVRRGGQRGIGCALITQRSAVLNKNVLTQAQMLVVLRTIAPQDLAAMKAWIDVHGTIEQGKELMDSLPALPIGDAWFWSPGWPTAEGIFARSHILPIQTFDSAATPKPGEKKVTPKNLADVDMDALKKQMAATIEKAKNDNPALLKKRIAELEKEVNKKHQFPLKTSEVLRELPPAIGVSQWMQYGEKYGYVKFFQDKVIKKGVLACMQEIARVNKEIQKISSNIAKAKALLPDTFPLGIMDSEGPWGTLQGIEHQENHSRVLTIKEVKNGIEALKRNSTLGHNLIDAQSSNLSAISISNPAQRILNAIAWMESIKIDAPDKRAVAFLADYSSGTGAFNNACGSLRTKGLILYPSGGLVELTKTGRELARFPDTILTQQELHRKVLDKLPNPHARILKALMDVYPESISNADLASRSGYAENTGSFNNTKGKLRTLGLIDYPSPGQVRAEDVLFI